MWATVVYESMYGNTKQVAEAVAAVLGCPALPVREVTLGSHAREAPFVVLGAPTHAWSMSRPQTRQAAAEAAAKPDSGVTLQPHATDLGMREWLADQLRLGTQFGSLALFDTRLKVPRVISGSAAHTMAQRLRRAGVELILPAQSFFVDKQNHLLPGELERAGRWAMQLVDQFAPR